MPLNLFIIFCGMLLCRDVSTNGYHLTTVQGLKKDTIYKVMTPVHIRVTGDPKNREVVFLESPRFFHLTTSDSLGATHLKHIQTSIHQKAKIKVGFTEDAQGEAVIVVVKAFVGK